MASINGHKAAEIFQGQALLYRHLYAFMDSMILKWMCELGIPDIIHNHGQPITLLELVSTLHVPPAKVSGVERLMRYLAHNGFFNIIRLRIHDNQEEKETYALTAASELLVKSTDHCLSSMVECFLYPNTWTLPFHQLRKWIYEEDLTLCDVTLGTSFWDFLNKNPPCMSSFNEAMASDSQIMNMALRDCNGVFEGLESIVDVGGGIGTTVKIICELFPELKCIVFDLPQVVENLSGNNNMCYVGGDMFQSIPKADGILLKWVLHNWGDNDCKRILENCREAISGGDKRGKVIIIDVVINEKGDEHNITGLKLLMDVNMACLFNGKERSEEEWKKLFMEAGFQGYKISPLTAYLSLIEAYP